MGSSQPCTGVAGADRQPPGLAPGAQFDRLDEALGFIRYTVEAIG